MGQKIIPRKSKLPRPSGRPFEISERTYGAGLVVKNFITQLDNTGESTPGAIHLLLELLDLRVEVHEPSQLHVDLGAPYITTPTEKGIRD